MTGYLYRGQSWLEEINAEIMSWRDQRSRPPRAPNQGAKCGTEAGYKRHRQLCEPACQRCLRATTQARKRRLEARKRDNRDPG